MRIHVYLCPLSETLSHAFSHARYQKRSVMRIHVDHAHYQKEVPPKRFAHSKYFRANALTQGICVTHRTSYTLTTTVATADGATTKSAFWIATAG